MRTLIALLLAAPALGVDHAKFRTCEKTGFCRRHRTAAAHPYVVAPGSLVLGERGAVSAQLHGGPFGVALTLDLLAFTCGVARMRITETAPLHGPRWEPSDILSTTLEPAALSAVGAADVGAGHALHAALAAGSASAYAFGAPGTYVAVHMHPFRAELYVGSAPAVSLNPTGKFYFEHHRKRDDAAAPKALPSGEDVHGGKTVVDYGEDGLAVYSDGTKQQALSGRFAAGGEAADGAAPVLDEATPDEPAADKSEDLWEESFGSHTDSKPFGPASVGMDVRFEGATHVYGLAEHAAPLNLPNTAGPDAHYKDPYRLWTLDVYDYELDSPMALYGGVPLLMAHTASSTVGALWFNPTETYVDVSRHDKQGSTDAYWMSESGVVDLMLLPGPSPSQIFAQYAALTGVTPLPPKFALGYHQCRWNYNDEADVRYVHGQFEELDIPYDVLWLDIEHTDGKRYFTWDSFKFPDPKKMQNDLAATGRKMVTIVDPHIKKDPDYAVYQEAHEKKLYIQKKDGTELDGWCWPGASAYLDFTSEGVRDWWAGRFAYDKYEGSTPHLYTWNDMNEPSVFNGPEVSMDKDAKSLAGVEHREWHNLYGMYMQQATAEGLLKRNPEQDKRPFVLSRAFYAGSQRWGAIWTGDNACKWDHLEAAMPMLLSMGLCGITFAGADVGGFLGKGGGYGDPDAELFTRWFATGAYQPFFRGHAHHDSARREPWTFDVETTGRLRALAAVRYQLLSYWYTTFHVAEATGMPTMRPLWVEFPADEKVFDMSHQYMAGSALLVHPITKQGASSTTVYFPGAPSVKAWYDVDDGTAYAAPAEAVVAAPIEKIPVYQRAGSIVPRQMRLRRSSALMGSDPYTLVLAPDAAGACAGELYLDPGDGYGYKQGAYQYRQYALAGGVLRSSAIHAGAFEAPNSLERVELLGYSAATAVTLRHAGATRALDFSYSPTTKRITVRKPDVPMADDWEISFEGLA